jgi:predicted transcriptional regulator
MATANRINVTLDDEYAAKLARLAERAHVQEGTLARSLLSRAIDEADVDARDIVALLDGIPGARARLKASLRDIEAGRTVPLETLRRRGEG